MVKVPDVALNIRLLMPLDISIAPGPLSVKLADPASNVVLDPLELRVSVRPDATLKLLLAVRVNPLFMVKSISKVTVSNTLFAVMARLPPLVMSATRVLFTIVPPLRLSVEPSTVTVPPLVSNVADDSVATPPPAASESESRMIFNTPEVEVMSALILMSLCALKVRPTSAPPVLVIVSLTVISPCCVPPAPVATMTLIPPFRADSILPVVRIALSAVEVRIVVAPKFCTFILVFTPAA